MKRHPRPLLASALFSIGIVLSVSLSWSQQDLKKSMPDGEGRDLAIDICTSCHNLERVLTAHKTKDEWEQLVNNMIARGATIFPEEVEPLVKYLVKNFSAAAR
jgi:hypothetical protein